MNNHYILKYKNITSPSFGICFSFLEKGPHLTVSDIFKTQRNNVTVDFGNLRYTQQNLWESRLEFNWRFGNKKYKNPGNW